MKIFDKSEITKFKNGDQFHSQFAQWVDQPPVGSVPVRLTPFMAEILMQYNTRNRPLSRAVVSNYKQEMVDKKWRHTGEPIIIADDGAILDGQHRLSACIRAKTPIDIDLRFGSKAENFAYVDIGRKRSTGDIFAINGVPNSNVIAAMTSFVYRLTHQKLSRTSSESVHNITAADYYDFYLQHASMQNSIGVYNALRKSKLYPPAKIAALHYLCAKKNKAQADKFFMKIADGVGFENKQEPAYTLYKRMMNNFTSPEKLSAVIIAAFVIKAWNAERAGKTIKSFQFRETEEMPKIK